MCEHQGQGDELQTSDSELTRREFLSTTGRTTAALGAAAIGLSAGEAAAEESEASPGAKARVPEGVVMLDELELIVIVDNETDTLSSVDDGVPQIPEIVRRVKRATSSRVVQDHECLQVFDGLCFACHGFSVLATGRFGDERRSILFDVGPSADLWLRNARQLGVDLAPIEHIFLSHWHADHSGGFADVAAAITQARTERGLAPPTIDVHPNRPDQRGIQLPSGKLVTLPPEPTFDALARSGARIVKESEPKARCGGFFFGSGEIPRVTQYETGLAGHHTIKGDALLPDPLILDERFLAAFVKGRGVTVLSACSHAGVVNACLEAKRRFPGAPVDCVLGGYHLAGKPMEPRIGPTIEDLKELIRPRLVAPGHCTGWRAKAELAGAFAPGRFGPSVVGTTYRLIAS